MRLRQLTQQFQLACFQYTGDFAQVDLGLDHCGEQFADSAINAAKHVEFAITIFFGSNSGV